MSTEIESQIDELTLQDIVSSALADELGIDPALTKETTFDLTDTTDRVTVAKHLHKKVKLPSSNYKPMADKIMLCKNLEDVVTAVKSLLRPHEKTEVTPG